MPSQRATHPGNRKRLGTDFALLLRMDAAMHGLQRRTFHAWMGALSLGTKQRLHSCVLRQPATVATRERADRSEQRAADAQYCSTQRRWKSLSRNSLSAAPRGCQARALKRRGAKQRGCCDAPEPCLATTPGAGAGATAAARAASVGSIMLKSLNQRLERRSASAVLRRVRRPIQMGPTCDAPRRVLQHLRPLLGHAKASKEAAAARRGGASAPRASQGAAWVFGAGAARFAPRARARRARRRTPRASPHLTARTHRPKSFSQLRVVSSAAKTRRSSSAPSCTADAQAISTSPPPGGGPSTAAMLRAAKHSPWRGARE